VTFTELAARLTQRAASLAEAQAEIRLRRRAVRPAHFARLLWPLFTQRYR
jgi:hypothetical protein